MARKPQAGSRTWFFSSYLNWSLRSTASLFSWICWSFVALDLLSDLAYKPSTAQGDPTHRAFVPAHPARQC